MKTFVMWFFIILGAFGLFAHLLHGELDWENALIGATVAAAIFTWISITFARMFDN